VSNCRPWVVKVAGDGGVGAIGGLGDAVEVLLEEIGGGDALGEGDCLVPEFGVGVDEDDFVDKVLAEEGTVEVIAAFEEEAEDVALGKSGEGGGEAEASGVVRDGFDLDSAFGESGDFGGQGGFVAEDEQVVRGGLDELGSERDAEVGVEDDAEKRASARQNVGAEEAAAGWILHSAAVGELRIVGEDGADAGEDSVGCVTEELDGVARGWTGEPVRLVGIARGG
jgi:hypothetical protein